MRVIEIMVMKVRAETIPQSEKGDESPSRNVRGRGRGHLIANPATPNRLAHPNMVVDQRQALRHQALHDCRHPRVRLEDGASFRVLSRL